MMTANTELGYWRRNKKWYRYDQEKNIFEMTEEAPERAKKSFEMCQEWMKMLEEKGINI